jgi:hypothetical protein
VEQDGAIATVVLNRPKMRNAISLAMSDIATVTKSLSKERFGSRDRVSGRRYGRLRLRR